jgi:hypothetical protein
MDDIMDVSSLKDVPSLSLDGCNGISDVSSLGNVRELTIDECDGVRDVSSLGSVYNLSLAGYRSSDVSSLQNIHILNLSHSLSTSDVSCLANSAVRVLFLSGCENIRDISMLKYVRRLDISECSNIISLSGLIALEDLTAISDYHRRMQILSGFETFSQLKSLKLGPICNKNERKVFTELSNAPLTEIEFNGWHLPAATDLSGYLKSLQHLHKLRFSYLLERK